MGNIFQSDNAVGGMSSAVNPPYRNRLIAIPRENPLFSPASGILNLGVTLLRFVDGILGLGPEMETTEF
jgi:hypothetical protein